MTDDEQTSPKKSKKSGLNNCMVYGDTCKLCENAESMKREQDNSYFQGETFVKFVILRQYGLLRLITILLFQFVVLSNWSLRH